MRLSIFAAAAAASVCTILLAGACSSVAEDGPAPDAAGEDVDGSSVDGANGTGDGGGGQDGATGLADGAKADGETTTDGAVPVDGAVDAGPPEVQLIGRFENDGTGDNFAFPGSRVVARFTGTGAVVKLRQTDGFSGGPSWFNVVVDGVLQAPLAVASATSTDYPVAQNLGAGVHTVELEKRTEGNLGVVRFEGFTFPGGALLAPPPRPARRIEFLSDSTIDGFGIEGTRVDALAANYCGADLAPPQYDNARKSLGTLSAAALGAEPFLLGYSGKGLTKNNDPGDPLLFTTLYNRALPDRAASVWGFGWKADVVVISLGGVDFDGRTTEPPGFTTAYGALVDKIRLGYPDAWIFLTVWSQIKDDNGPTRTAMTTSLQSVINARAADLKLSLFRFPQANVNTDETGCQYHANEAHHAAMAALLTSEIKLKTGW